MMSLDMDFDSIQKVGSGLGSGAVIVMDETVCMVKMLERISKFYMHESCGQCTPCREGTGWLYDVLRKVCTGQGKVSDVDLLVDISNNMMGNTICALADGTAMPMLAFVRKYRDEFVAACKNGGIGDKRLDDSVKSLF